LQQRVHRMHRDHDDEGEEDRPDQPRGCLDARTDDDRGGGRAQGDQGAR